MNLILLAEFGGKGNRWVNIANGKWQVASSKEQVEESSGQKAETENQQPNG